MLITVISSKLWIPFIYYERFRHDLKNHVIAMDVFIAKKQYQELEVYFHETFSSLGSWKMK